MDRRSRKTLAAIREAFLGLVATKSFDKITVTEIARAADIDRKTFYLHYDSIDALTDEILREDTEQLCSAMAEVSTDEQGHINVLELFKMLETHISANIDSRTTLLRHADQDRTLSKLEPILVQNFIEKDSLKLHETLGPYLDVFVAFFYSGLITTYKRYLEKDKDLPLEDLAAMTSAALAGGISALTEAAPKYVSKNLEA